MKTWEYVRKSHASEQFPALAGVPGLDPFTVTDFPLPARRRVYLANGIIGLRLPANPLLGADVAVNGLMGRTTANGVEGYAPAPYPLEADLVVNKDRLSERPDLVQIKEQSLNMSFGELTTQLTFHAQQANLDVTILTFASRSLPTAICQEITVSPDRDCALKMETNIDPRGLPGRSLMRRMPDSEADAVLWWETRDGLATVGASFRAELSGGEEVTSYKNDWGMESEVCTRGFSMKAKAHSVIVLRQIGSLVPSIMNHEPHWQALRMVAFGWIQGFERLRYENQRNWMELWQGRPVVTAEDPSVQRVIDSSFYYLHASIHPCSPCSMAPYGLSRAEGYYSGHIFIDNEAIMFQVLLLTAPDAAKASLDYRSRLIEAARMNARCMGYQGIMFPWESANTGCEVTPPTVPTAVMEFSNHAIVQAFLRYFQATGDRFFLQAQVWPLLRGAADWVVSRVTRTDRGYEVRNLIAEETEANTHNDVKINKSFIEMLRWAIDMSHELGFEPKPIWEEVADNILILTDEADILRETAEKQILPPLSKENIKAVMNGTEGVNGLEPIGTPIGDLTALVKALEIGDRSLAAWIWDETVKAHWQGDFGGFREWGLMWNGSQFDHDCFLTWPGNLLKHVIFELPGLEISNRPLQDWCVKPVLLPEGWEKIEVERLWIGNKRVRLTARHGDQKAILMVVD